MTDVVTCSRCGGKGVMQLTPGEVVQAARRAAGLSQSALAVKAGVSRFRLSEIEHGENTTFETLGKLAGALGLRVVVRLEEMDK